MAVGKPGRGIWVHWDLSPFLNVKRFAQKNRPTLLKVAAERYAKYLKNRYIQMAAGRGDWLPLTERTIENKTRRSAIPDGAKNPYWILRETDDLMLSIKARQRNQSYVVGYVENRLHKKLTPDDRDITLLELIKIHQGITPQPRTPVRPIIVLPDRRTNRKMVEDVRDEYNKVIRRNRKK